MDRITDTKMCLVCNGFGFHPLYHGPEENIEMFVQAIENEFDPDVSVMSRMAYPDHGDGCTKLDILVYSPVILGEVQRFIEGYLSGVTIASSILNKEKK